MIVTITAAGKDAADHLIGYRARALVREHADPDVVNINRKEISDESYELFNQARAVLLVGSPGYQSEIYPDGYNLDLARIETPVLPFGLSWQPDTELTAAASAFVTQLHADATRFSAAPDRLTVEMLSAHAIKNVALTGCPSWYDLAKLDADYSFNPSPERIVVSAPSLPQASLAEVINRLAKLFPQAEKWLAFNSGFRSLSTKNTGANTRWNFYLRAHAKMRSFRSVNLEGDLDAFTELMSAADLHVGYQQHSHFFALSQRIGSVLLTQQSRDHASVIDDLLANEGAEVRSEIEFMRQTYPEMVRFLKQL